MASTASRQQFAGVDADDAGADDPAGFSLSMISLVMPSVRAMDRARPLAAQGKAPFSMSIPFALASVSVTPTQATSGSV
jgi:hypothetical protein